MLSCKVQLAVQKEKMSRLFPFGQTCYSCCGCFGCCCSVCTLCLSWIPIHCCHPNVENNLADPDFRQQLELYQDEIAPKHKKEANERIVKDLKEGPTDGALIRAKRKTHDDVNKQVDEKTPLMNP